MRADQKQFRSRRTGEIETFGPPYPKPDVWEALADEGPLARGGNNMSDVANIVGGVRATPELMQRAVAKARGEIADPWQPPSQEKQHMTALQVINAGRKARGELPFETLAQAYASL